MKRILTSIWFLALIITIPLIAMMPTVFNKYRIVVDSIEKRAALGGHLYFVDLNDDNESERVESFETEQGFLAFQCFNQEGGLYDQFNFPQYYHPTLSNLFFFDNDNNGLKEVYAFTVKEDSVFISAVEPYSASPDFSSSFVTTIDVSRRNDLDITVSEVEYFDFDADGVNEIVFSISVGYNWFPRKLFVFHPDEGKVQSSEEFGVHFSLLKSFDYMQDGKAELICVSSSAKNISLPGIKYSDDRPRLFVFNADLKEEFPPVNLPEGIGSRVKYYIIDEKEGQIILLYYNYSTENAETFASTVFVDGRTQKNDTLFFDDCNWQTAEFIREDFNRFLVFTDRGKLWWIDHNLNVIDKLDLQFNLQHLIKEPLDILDGGKQEYYTLDAKNRIHIFLNDFQDEIELITELNATRSSLLLDSPKKNQFIVTTDELLQYTSIRENPFYYLKYPIYFVIYLFFTWLIWIWQRARLRLVKEKYELRNQVRDLRLKTFRNQLNPHFIFNTFNGVASVIKKGNTEQAYEVFMRFSRMTRSVLDNFEESIVPLRDELDLVSNYIELQKFRFKDLFDYEIQVQDKSMYDIPVPRMIIQVHVENAIQHGLIPKAGKGFLKLEMKTAGDALNITIEDNGIGREKSRATRTAHNGLGLKTIKSVIDEVNHGKKNKIRQVIIDLKTDKGEPCGTRIELYIPKNVTK